MADILIRSDLATIPRRKCIYSTCAVSSHHGWSTITVEADPSTHQCQGTVPSSISVCPLQFGHLGRILGPPSTCKRHLTTLAPWAYCHICNTQLFWCLFEEKPSGEIGPVDLPKATTVAGADTLTESPAKILKPCKNHFTRMASPTGSGVKLPSNATEAQTCSVRRAAGAP